MRDPRLLFVLRDSDVSWQIPVYCHSSLLHIQPSFPTASPADLRPSDPPLVAEVEKQSSPSPSFVRSNTFNRALVIHIV